MFIESKKFPLEKYICKICKQLLQEPRECNKCKEKYCMKCITSDSSFKDVVLCKDNCQRNLAKCNKNLENLIQFVKEIPKNDLHLVKESKDKEKSLHERSNKCQWCNISFTRKEMKLHKVKCFKRYIECEFCFKMIKYLNKNEHLMKCEEYLLFKNCKEISSFHYNINEIKPICSICNERIDIIVDIKVCKRCRNVLCLECVDMCDGCKEILCLECFKDDKNLYYYWFLRNNKQKLCKICLGNKCKICNKFPVNPNNIYEEYCYRCREKNVCKHCLKDCMYCDRKICSRCSSYCYNCKKYYCDESNSNFIERSVRYLINNILCLHSKYCY
jgi:hypothetical protein